MNENGPKIASRLVNLEEEVEGEEEDDGKEVQEKEYNYNGDALAGDIYSPLRQQRSTGRGRPLQNQIIDDQLSSSVYTGYIQSHDERSGKLSIGNNQPLYRPFPGRRPSKCPALSRKPQSRFHDSEVQDEKGCTDATGGCNGPCPH